MKKIYYIEENATGFDDYAEIENWGKMMVPHLYSSKKEAIESCKALNRTNPDKGVVSFSVRIVDAIDFIYQLAGKEVDEEEVKTTEKNGWDEIETVSLRYVEE
jgi:hypothetical protein